MIVSYFTGALIEYPRLYFGYRGNLQSRVSLKKKLNQLINQWRRLMVNKQKKMYYIVAK